MFYNYHTHTCLCDGENTAEEMVQKAIELNISELGFSGHSYTEFDKMYCMSPDDTELYKEVITALKSKYKNKIKLLLGIECDYLSDIPLEDYDYIIGSVHYIEKNGEYFSVDSNKEDLIKSVNHYYNGDFYSFIEDYYSLVADVYNKTKCDIIGHFDLVTKYNTNNALFDTNHSRYIAAWKKAADTIIKTPAVVEINTGAMARGYAEKPYPAKEIIDYFKSSGKKMIFSSDCHNKDYLLFGYEEVKKYL